MFSRMNGNKELNPLLKAVDLGFQAEAFLQSDIGRYLVSRAEAQIDEAVEALKEADPEDPKAIRALQNTIAVAESVQYWLADVIQQGENAQQQLHEGEQ